MSADGYRRSTTSHRSGCRPAGSAVGVSARSWSPNAELRAEVERLLAAYFGGHVPVVRLERRASPFASTHPLEELDVVLGDGHRLELVLKKPGVPAVSGVPPTFLRDRLREVGVYRTLLEPARLGSPILYGVGGEGSRSGPWLLLERVAGRELYQVGHPAPWRAAARWLGFLHARFERFRPPSAARLLVRDPAFHMRWLRRARARARLGRAPPATHRALQSLEEPVRLAALRLDALPRTFLHGEFYASNVLVEGDGDGAHARPVDWEMAALGPAPIDLAALTSGGWTDAEKQRMIASYREALLEVGARPPDPDALVGALESARLCLAVQWLGWSARWTPPPTQARDWLAEARAAAARVGGA